MSLLTYGETYSRLIEHLRLAQEDAANLAHIANSETISGTTVGRGWLTISEALKLMQHKVTQLATAKLN